MRDKRLRKVLFTNLRVSVATATKIQSYRYTINRIILLMNIIKIVNFSDGIDWVFRMNYFSTSQNRWDYEINSFASPIWWR